MVVPIRESMAQPEYFAPVLSVMVGFIGMPIASFSLLTYLAWGDTLADVAINQQFEGGDCFLNILKMIYVLSSYLNYSFIMFPTFSITETLMFAKWNKQVPSKARQWTKNAFRTFVTVLAGLIAFRCAS